jgi:predicted RNA-binding protein with RPS1 domain
VKNVRDWFKPGDKVRVKVVGLGEDGKFSLSKKALEQKPAGAGN